MKRTDRVRVSQLADYTWAMNVYGVHGISMHTKIFRREKEANEVASHWRAAFQQDIDENKETGVTIPPDELECLLVLAECEIETRISCLKDVAIGGDERAELEAEISEAQDTLASVRKVAG